MAALEFMFNNQYHELVAVLLGANKQKFSLKGFLPLDSSGEEGRVRVPLDIERLMLEPLARRWHGNSSSNATVGIF
jgi:hypothetical protein